MEFYVDPGRAARARMDYVAPSSRSGLLCLAVEKLLGITNDVPEQRKPHSYPDDGTPTASPRTSLQSVPAG